MYQNQEIRRESLKPNIINLDVFSSMEQHPLYFKMSADENSSLKSFSQSCYYKLSSLTDQNVKIQYIQIKDQHYEESDERTLKELGLKNLSTINLYVINKGRQKEGNMNQVDYNPKILNQESLINNYQNILFSTLEAEQKEQVIQLEKEILIQSFSNNCQNQNLTDNQTFKHNKHHMFNNAFKRNFDELKKSNNLIDPLTEINQQQVIEKENQKFNEDFLIFVLANQLKQQGQMVYQTKQDDKLNILSLQASFGYGLEENSCHQLKIKSQQFISFQQLKDQNKLNEFYNNIKHDLAEQLGIPFEYINLLQIEEGSIKVYFIITNAAGVKEKIEWNTNINQIYKKYGDAELVLHSYFQDIQLSPKDFDPEYNMEWEMDHIEYQLRGPKNDQLKYFFPRGWKGYALNVKGKYNNGNDDWLRMDGNQNEWHIMFHGTKQQFVKDIVEKGLIPGQRQLHDDKIDLRRGEEIGVGVYFSNHIEVCEKHYIKPIEINGANYIVVFQSRVNPQKLKQVEKKSDITEKRGNPDWDNDYFVVNSTEDIRPYRILLKKYNKQVERKSCDIF